MPGAAGDGIWPDTGNGIQRHYGVHLGQGAAESKHDRVNDLCRFWNKGLSIPDVVTVGQHKVYS